MKKLYTLCSLALLLLLALTCWLVSMALARRDFEEGMADHVG